MFIRKTPLNFRQKNHPKFFPHLFRYNPVYIQHEINFDLINGKCTSPKMRLLYSQKTHSTCLKIIIHNTFVIYDSRIIIHDVFVVDFADWRCLLKKSGVCSFSMSRRPPTIEVARRVCEEGARSTPGKKYNPYVRVHGERRMPSECI